MSRIFQLILLILLLLLTDVTQIIKRDLQFQIKDPVAYLGLSSDLLVVALT